VRFSLAAFAPLRLCKNRRLNKEAHSRKGAKAQRRRHLFFKDNKFVGHRARGDNDERPEKN
jgi:hypothetical protein